MCVKLIMIMFAKVQTPFLERSIFTCQPKGLKCGIWKCRIYSCIMEQLTIMDAKMSCKMSCVSLFNTMDM
jgi:hypothetical protein